MDAASASRPFAGVARDAYALIADVLLLLLLLLLSTFLLSGVLLLKLRERARARIGAGGARMACCALVHKE